VPKFLAVYGLAGYAIFLAGAILEILGHNAGVALSIPRWGLAPQRPTCQDNAIESAHTLMRSGRPGSASDAAEPGRRLWTSCG
jgi:hypothetical protein